MTLRHFILHVLFVANASAQSFIFESHPGCWTGPRRSTIEAAENAVPVLCYYNDDDSRKSSLKIGTPSESKAIAERLVNLELTKDELNQLSGLDTMIGPAHFDLSVTLNGRAWKVRYPASLTNLTPEKKKILKYDAPTLAMIAKIEKIHSTVTGLIPKEDAEPVSGGNGEQRR